MQADNNDPLDRPLYKPYRWAAADFQLGLRPIRPDMWILIGAEHAQMMRQKRERLDRYPAFFYRALPGSLQAQRELRDGVIAHLLQDHAGSFEADGAVIRSVATGRTLDPGDDGTEPLLQLSHLIEEDFMLLQEVDGVARITAASNAYSSSGRLVASVGRGMDWAHESVPGLTQRLGRKIDRVLGSVNVATPCERFNWQVTPMGSVFFPHQDPHAANAAAMCEVSHALRRDPARAGELLWMRVERQTLSRLPQTHAVAFSIHTFSDPLSCLGSDVASAQAILSLLRGYSSQRWQYSEMNIVREPLMAWLESVVGGAVVGAGN